MHLPRQRDDFSGKPAGDRYLCLLGLVLVMLAINWPGHGQTVYSYGPAANFQYRCGLLRAGFLPSCLAKTGSHPHNSWTKSSVGQSFAPISGIPLAFLMAVTTRFDTARPPQPLLRTIASLSRTQQIAASSANHEESNYV